MIELPALTIDSIVDEASGPTLLLANLDPAPAEAAVPIDTLLALEVFDTGSSGVRRQGLRVWVNESLAVDGSAAVQICVPYAGPHASISESPGCIRVVLHPAAPLSSLAQITIRVAAQSGDGQAQLDQQYTFEVEDKTPPRLLAAQATAPRQIQVAFDEPIGSTPAGSFALRPLMAPAITPTAVATSVRENSVWLTLSTDMTPEVDYELSAVGVADVFGNAVSAPHNRVTVTWRRALRPSGRRFDLWEMIPAHNRRDDHTGDLRRFVACLQEVTDLLLADLDRWPQIFDLERAPEPFVDLILADLGNPFPFALGLNGKRRLAAVLIELYQQKGTALGIRNAIRFFVGLDGVQLRPFAADTLTLGESELGTSWVLGPSHRFARYAFDVLVPRRLTADEQIRIRQICDLLRPAHTHFVQLLEPTQTPPPAHWELGESALGETSFLH